MYVTFQQIKLIKKKKPNIEIIYRGQLLPNPPDETVSLKDICADRAKYLAKKPKKREAKRDFG